ncbi:universal stress protein [Natrialbaceae archaeon GCM10025810]|uniref:universal stress protein n=1 Tax=Halovalidus salilacus TaxID=3075124 RepID=UPI00360B7993
MIDRILVPVDGSDPARAALDHALEIADDLGATVVLLYVADTNEPSQVRLGVEVVDVLEEEGAEELSRARDRADERAPDVPIVDDVVQGEPASAIVDYAGSNAIDLVAMGTHGRRGIEGYVLGSVAERVVNASPMPVLTVRSGDDATANYPYRSVLVPTDGSDHARAALDLGTAFATRHGASVHLLTVVDDAVLGLVGVDGAESDDEGVPDRLESAAGDVLEDAEAAARAAGVDDVVTAVRSGSVPAEIRSYAAEHGVDLIAMGTHGRTGIDQRLLGSFTERVLRTAPMPVVTTRWR